jgi:hypothetical protein
MEDDMASLSLTDRNAQTSSLLCKLPPELRNKFYYYVLFPTISTGASSYSTSAHRYGMRAVRSSGGENWFTIYLNGLFMHMRIDLVCDYLAFAGHGNAKAITRIVIRYEDDEDDLHLYKKPVLGLRETLSALGVNSENITVDARIVYSGSDDDSEIASMRTTGIISPTSRRRRLTICDTFGYEKSRVFRSGLQYFA